MQKTYLSPFNDKIARSYRRKKNEPRKVKHNNEWAPWTIFDWINLITSVRIQLSIWKRFYHFIVILEFTECANLHKLVIIHWNILYNKSSNEHHKDVKNPVIQSKLCQYRGFFTFLATFSCHSVLITIALLFHLTISNLKSWIPILNILRIKNKILLYNNWGYIHMTCRITKLHFGFLSKLCACNIFPCF